MARIGLVLSGCGFQDGTEIQEAVVAMLALEENGAELTFLAPNTQQTLTVNHDDGKTIQEARNVLNESSRITRGHVVRLDQAKADELDGIVLPGGFGAALNLSDFGTKQAAMSVNADLESLLIDMHRSKKPIGALCIAPVILAKVLGQHSPRLTIGNDPETAAACTQMGAEHVACKVDDIVVDGKNLLVTTPAYMLAERVKDIHTGIRKLAVEVLNQVAARN